MTPRPMQSVGAHPADEDDITMERRVRVPGPTSELISSRKTTKMDVIDARLIAIAKGEIEPEDVPADRESLVALDDPFGGLIPVDDDGREQQAIDDDWLVYDYTPEPVTANAIVLTNVPRLCVSAASIVSLPLDARSGFLLSHIDGVRSVEELIDVANLTIEDTLDVLAGLANLGAITVE